MAGLMCLTLVKLDDRHAFRSWARTARIAAQEAGDPVTHSWVRAQEAYGHYYAGDLPQAIDVAQDAQRLAAQTPCVGAILAAALEARAHAALGRPTETRDALIRAEWILPRLDADSLVPSAFGYNEAQLRFHESSALTHLRDARGAWTAQERALQLTPEYDYTDRALTQLDRATCLVYEGDAAAAAECALRALSPLTNEHRRGIILLRAQNIIGALPAHEQTRPEVTDLRDLVMDSSAGGDE
jgi:tetratricopeptide (TPR) repeat protein